MSCIFYSFYSFRNPLSPKDLKISSCLLGDFCRIRKDSEMKDAFSVQFCYNFTHSARNNTH